MRIDHGHLRTLAAVVRDALGRIGISEEDMAATCTPAFLDRYFANGVPARSLARAPVLAFNRKDALQARFAKKMGPRKTGTLRSGGCRRRGLSFRRRWPDWAGR